MVVIPIYGSESVQTKPSSLCELGMFYVVLKKSLIDMKSITLSTTMKVPSPVLKDHSSRQEILPSGTCELIILIDLIF